MKKLLAPMLLLSLLVALLIPAASAASASCTAWVSSYTEANTELEKAKAVVCWIGGSYGEGTITAHPSEGSTLSVEESQAAYLAKLNVGEEAKNLTIANLHIQELVLKASATAAANHVTVEHNEFTGGSGSAITNTASVSTVANNNITIARNTIHSYSEYGVKLSYFEHLAVNGENVYSLQGGKAAARLEHGSFLAYTFNYAHDMQGEGLRVSAVTHLEVEQNLTVKTQNKAESQPAMTIVNSTASTIKLNTSWETGTTAIEGSGETPTAALNHNVLVTALGSSATITDDFDYFKEAPTGFTKGAHSKIEASPSFTDTTKADYVLSPNTNKIGVEWFPPLVGGYGPVPPSGVRACTVTVSTIASALTEAQKTGSPVVCIKGGTYTPSTTGQEVCKEFGYTVEGHDACWLVSKGPESGEAVIRPVTGETVTIKGLTQLYGSHITLRKLALGQVKVGLSEETTPEHDTLSEDTGTNFHVGSSKYLTVEGGSWGPSSCDPIGDKAFTLKQKEEEPGWPGSNNKIEESWGSHDPEFVAIRNTTIHDVQSYKEAGKAEGTIAEKEAEECHTEGLAIFAGKHVSVTGNHFYKDSIYDILTQNQANPEFINITSNWFAAPKDETGANGVEVGALNGPPLESEIIKNIEVRANHANGVMEFGNEAVTHTNDVVAYNFGLVAFKGYEYCTAQPGISWIENVWLNAEVKCGTDKDLNNEAPYPFPYTNTANDSTLNYTLTGIYKAWPE